MMWKQHFVTIKNTNYILLPITDIVLLVLLFFGVTAMNAQAFDSQGDLKF
jgi:biopolymer transport protein ExbD